MNAKTKFRQRRDALDSNLRYSERKMLDEARAGKRHEPTAMIEVLERLARERHDHRQAATAQAVRESRS